MKEIQIKFAATSDIHAPKYLNVFAKSLARINNLDFFLIGGDMILKGEIKQYDKILELVTRKFDCPILAVFGNEEYEDLHDQIRTRYSSIEFLDDEVKILNVKGINIGIVGTTGSLDELTWWQAKNRPENLQIYKHRIEKIDKLLSELQTEVKILLSHYALTYETMKGERTFSYPQLGSKHYEGIIKKYDLKYAFHGHVHKGLSQIKLGNTNVFNISIPKSKRIKVINLKFQNYKET